jgi:hypothetical protein
MVPVGKYTNLRADLKYNTQVHNWITVTKGKNNKTTIKVFYTLVDPIWWIKSIKFETKLQTN